jgi:hypothetical protein
LGSSTGDEACAALVRGIATNVELVKDNSGCLMNDYEWVAQQKKVQNANKGLGTIQSLVRAATRRRLRERE